ncbi:hypothetical protein N7478_006134 [Penicillium angulare]|uniref:uncharacterized protein n=1 Tax=Penicillium angulare TaxID=116970 RepID=UPI00253FE777|nr:uncharacterized protein N7478_006134 [Penicillium angulare]KAJ5280762.1 hypothetical protein N7478_006134 [Penicillium angulare]
MSSFSDNHQPSSSQYLPPQSAQVRGSLFGGPSSDAEPPPSSLPEPNRRSIFGGFSSQDVDEKPEKQLEPIQEGPEQEEDEFDMILRERPLEAYYGSDGDSFRGSSDEDSKKAKKALKKTQNSGTRVPQPAEVVAPQPTYILHRGVDLPPGVERPNRWQGWPYHYRYAIANEVSVLDSLMTTRARDLAGHLYDSFASRQQRNQIQGEFGNAEDSNDEEITTVPKKWISWPMPADSVPREDEPIRSRLDGLDNYRLQPDMRPSAELEEWIMAAIMKTAKERFLAREWEGVNLESIKKEESPDPDAMVVDGHEEDEDPKWNLPERPFREPVVQTDDDLSRSQLRPLSRTVISQLDQILMGLHQALKHRANHHYSSDESATEDEDEESVPPEKEKGRKQYESRGRKRNRETKKPETSSPDRARSSRSSSDTDIEANDTLENTELTEDAHGRVPLALSERLPLRDWSEVMGIAAIMGLPSNAVQRASKRCADIFEQDMTFRKFREGRMVKTKRHRLPGGQNSQQFVYAESESENESESGFDERRPRVRGTARFPKRVADNVPEGTSRGTESVSRHSSKAREEATPKRSRSPSTARSTPLSVSQSYGKNPNRESIYFCPVEGCRRSNNGFNRLWNYKLHMKRIHAQQCDQPSKLKKPAISLDHFIQRQRVLALWREIVRALHKIPPSSTRDELHSYARGEFERHREVTDVPHIRYLLSTGKSEFDMMRRYIDEQVAG